MRCRHSGADAFPEDGGIFSRRSPQIRQIFWDLEQMDSIRRYGRGMSRPHNALVINALSSFGCGRVSRRWRYFFTQKPADQSDFLGFGADGFHPLVGTWHVTPA